MGALSLTDGTPTGGVYGFAAIAMEIVKKIDPTKVISLGLEIVNF